MKLVDKLKKVALIVIPIWLVIVISLFIHQKLSINIYTTHKESSTFLKSLIIEGHDIDFDPNQDFYEIAIGNDETSLAIKAVAEDRSATIKIFNNDDLTNHDEVYIYVTSKDHNIRKYTIGYNNKAATRYFNTNIDSCTKIESDYCIKFFNLRNNNYTNFLIFTYDYLTTEGYPHTNTISINDKVFFTKSLKNGEFHNFNIIDDKVIFTYNNVNENNKINLFGVNTNGNTILDHTLVNPDYKDLYTYDIAISSTEINLKTRLTNLNKDNICKLNNDNILEARYTINYNNGVYEEPILNNKLTVLEYKMIMNIKCNN